MNRIHKKCTLYGHTIIHALRAGTSRKGMIKRAAAAVVVTLITMVTAFMSLAAVKAADSTDTGNFSSPIIRVFDPEGALSCVMGQPPEAADYPEKVRVAYQKQSGVNDQMDIPVKWDLSAINFAKADSYSVPGVFTSEVLADNQLSNPEGITPHMIVTVQKQGSITTLTSVEISISKSGWTTVRLRMPQLPPEVTALRIYQSSDGRYWSRMSQKMTPVQAVKPENDNFLNWTIASSPYEYVTCRFQTDYRPLQLKVEVAGSAYDGMSNIVQIDATGTANPGEGLDGWDSVEDGSFDGGSGSSGGSGKGGISDGTFGEAGFEPGKRSRNFIVE